MPKKLCKLCIEEKVDCIYKEGDDKIQHNLIEVNEIIPNENIINMNNEELENIQEKIKIFKQLKII